MWRLNRRSRLVLLGAATGLLVAAAQARVVAQEAPSASAEKAARTELQASVAEMSRLMAAGQKTEAVKLAEATEQRTRARLGAEHPLVAAALYNLGSAYRAVARTQAAVEAFEAALVIEAKAGSPATESYRRTLNALARLELDRGQPGRAIHHYKAAIASLPAQPTGEAASAKAELIEETGQLLRHMGNYPEAEAMLREALQIRERAVGPADRSVAGALNMLGGIARVQGKHAEAEAFYKRAIDIATATRGSGDPNTAILIDNLAVLYQQTGRLTEAEALQKRVLAVFDEKLGLDHPTSAQAAANLAANYQSQARYGESLALFQRALDVYLKKLPDNDPRLGFIFDNIAGVLRAMGRLDSAMSFYQRALATLQKAYPPEHPEIGVALNNLSVVHSTLGRHAEAEAFALRALQIAEAAHGEAHPGVAISLGNLSEALAGQGKLAEARKPLERAIGIVENTLGVEHPMLVLPLHQLSGLLAAADKIGEALPHARRAVAIESAARLRERQLRLDGSERSRAKGEAVPRLLDLLWRSGEADPKRRQAAAVESFEAAQVTSLSQAGVALAQLGARLGAANAELAALARERQDLAGQWSDADRALGAAVSRRAAERKPEQEAELRSRLTDIDARLRAIDQRIGREFPAFQDLSLPRALTVEEGAALLMPDEALLAYSVDHAHVYGWSLAGGRIAWQRLSIPARDLVDKVQALRCGLDGGEWADPKRAQRCQKLFPQGPEGGLLPFEASLAHDLYKALIEPFAADIGKRHLLVVASGPLTSLPLNVLLAAPLGNPKLEQAQWLGISNPITTVPTAASLRTLRAQAKPSLARKPYFGIGNPLLDGAGGDTSLAFAAQTCIAPRPGKPKLAHAGAPASDLPSVYLRSGLTSVTELRRLSPLPETRDEICAVAAGVGAGDEDIALGARANERVIRELSAAGALAGYRVLHFATHGLVAGEISGLAEPALVLTPPSAASSDNDGLLTASEVAGLKLDADWVIMSACNTAAGEKLGAEALSGLARSFFYAGARALLVSHWPVQSSAAVKLTTRALAEIQGDPSVGRAEALRRAMASLIADTAEAGNWHPQVWAPFAVVGEGAVWMARAAAGPTEHRPSAGGMGGAIVPPITPSKTAPGATRATAPVAPPKVPAKLPTAAAAGKESSPKAKSGPPDPAPKQAEPKAKPSPAPSEPTSIFKAY